MQMKVHMYNYIESAHKAFWNGDVDRDVAMNQTKCGYMRELITQKEDEVTCKLCLKEMRNK